jgi:glycylpeptide N-tetradecanoyltransferase
VKKMCEINYLCVHKKLRSKRLAPVLIKEVTRRVNLQGMFQAVYTAGTQLPKPVSACQYFHRLINVRKLCDIRFTRLPPKMTMNLFERMHKLEGVPRIPGIRPMTAADVPACCAMLNVYLRR